MADIACSFGEVNLENNRKSGERLTATLRKPAGFQGTPIFADDREINPAKDPVCQIRPDYEVPDGLGFRLQVTDLERCGVLVKNVSKTMYFFFTTKAVST